MAGGITDFSKSIGVTQDLRARGMGIRGQRYAMIIENGVVKKFNLEKLGQFEVSSAEYVLGQL
jgi:peroxiredoxin